MKTLKVFINRHKTLLIQYLRFNIVAVIYTAITYLLFSALIYFGVKYQIALVFDYLTGVLLSFFLNKRFTFKVKEKANIIMLSKMIAVYLVHFVLNLLALNLVVSIFSEKKIALYLGQLGIIVLLSLMSFIFQKIFVFKIKKRGSNQSGVELYEERIELD